MADPDRRAIWGRAIFPALALTLVLGLTLACMPELRAAEASGAPQAAIAKVLDGETAAWNRGDIDAFMKGYDDSPRTAMVGGATVEYGYAAILAQYKRAYANPAAMGKLSFSNLAIRMLGSDYAVVTGNFHIERVKAAGGNLGGIFSLVFMKTTAGWKIILDHTSAG